MSAHIFIGLLFFAIPGGAGWLYGASRPQWERRQLNIAFVLGMAGCVIWWIVGIFTMAWAVDGGFAFSVVFGRMWLTLAFVSGFLATITGRLASKRSMHGVIQQ